MNRPAFVLALEALVCSALLSGTLLIRPPAWETVRSLEPRPDALEYCVSALRLATGQGYSLPIGAGAYPPRYEPGFPLLLAAWFRLTGLEVEPAARLLQLLSAAGVMLFWFGCRRWFGGPASTFASTLLVLCGLQITSARVLMCEPLLFALGCGLLACLTHLDRATASRCFVIGLLAAALGAVRLTHWLGAAALLGWLASAGHRRKSVPAYLVGVSIVLTPWLLFRALRFGAPWNSGYSYWLPEIHGAQKTFSASYLLRVGDGPGSLESYLRWILDPDLGAWPFAGMVLAAVGAAGVWLRRPWGRQSLGPVFAVLGVPLLPMLIYFYLDPRFLVPALPLAALATAAGFELLSRDRGRGLRALGWSLATAALLQAGWSCYRLGAPSVRQARAGELDGLKALQPVVRPGDVVVTDASLVLTSWTLPGIEPMALALWEDEHLARIKGSGLRALSVGPGPQPASAETFPAPALFVDQLRPHASALAVFQEAWRGGARVFVLLASHSAEWPRLAPEVVPLGVRLVDQGRGWVLLRLEPASGPDRGE